MTETTRSLDTTGLVCPLPVLKARKALKEMAAGETLTVVATDPASKADFRHFCETTGHELLESQETEGILTYVIRKQDRKPRQ